MDLAELAKKYYGLVDSYRISESEVDESVLDQLLDLFAEDAVYQRCEREFKGRKELEDLYRNQRTMMGRHKIKNMVIEGRQIGIEGTFFKKNGSEEGLKFADFFVYNAEGLIQRRGTYLGEGFKKTV